MRFINCLFVLLLVVSPLWAAPLVDFVEQPLANEHSNETVVPHPIPLASNNDKTPVEKEEKERVLASTSASSAAVDGNNNIKDFTDTTYWPPTTDYTPSNGGLEWWETFLIVLFIVCCCCGGGGATYRARRNGHWEPARVWVWDS